MRTRKNNGKITDAQLHSQARGDNPFEPRWIMKPDAEGNIYWQKWNRNNGRVKVNKWKVWIDGEDGGEPTLMTVDEFCQGVQED